MPTVFEGEWSCIDDVIGWAPEELRQCEVLYAAYDTRTDYEGYALCIYRKDGKLFEVTCSHCSCNGLDEWEPEETTAEAILMRPGTPEALKKLLKGINQ